MHSNMTATNLFNLTLAANNISNSPIDLSQTFPSTPLNAIEPVEIPQSPLNLSTHTLDSLREPQTLTQTQGCNLPFEDIFDFNIPIEPRAKQPIPEQTTFADVAGVEEAKQELQEIVDFLKTPERFSKIGATVPKGVLLSGPPGTGKTLLARAVAGEAQVPFHAASGSEFVELYVGQGAARVRNLFAQARRNTPAIIFIDEIDAVGKQRSSGGPSNNDEREQTLNQLLTEMNGFSANKDIIVLGATNRIDTLDSALLRPGRFDRKVTVDLPDRAGREKILAVHAAKYVMAADADLTETAKRTPGFAGADLANLLNEAAILAVRNDRDSVSMVDLNAAIDRVLAGPEKIGTFMSEEHKRLVAYHEAGHAIVAHLSPEFDRVQKVSIIPRGQSGGSTWFIPNEKVAESGLASRRYLKSNIAVALGGRIAEEIIFDANGVTTGASNDIEKGTQVARSMVEKYGMSQIGPINIDNDKNSFSRTHSEALAELSDNAVRTLIKEGYDEALSILSNNLDKLDTLAEMLMQKEVIEGKEFRLIMGEPWP